MTRALVASLSTLALASSLSAAPQYIARVDLPVAGATHAAAADLDGDSALDIVAVADATSTLYVYYGRGDGTFRFPPEVYATDRNPAFVALGDLTDDSLTSLPDILVVTRQGTVSTVPNINGDLAVFQNSGAPAGSATPRFLVSCADIFLDGSGNRNGNQPGFALLEDFNADLKLDIVAASEFGNSIQSLFQGYANPDPACRTTNICNFGFANATGCTPTSTGSVNPAALAAGPFLPRVNTNGKIDVVALNAGATPSARVTYHLHLNANTDKFTTLSTQSFPIGNGSTTGLGASMMVADDLNGDGVPDLLFSDSASGQISVLRALDPASLASPIFSTPSQEYPAGDNPVWIATGEFAAGSATDPARDAVVSNRAIDRTSVIPAPRADATFVEPMCYPTGDGPRALGVADFNGDGAEDLLITNDRAGSVSVLLARSTPNAGFDTAYRRSTGGLPSAIAMGDVNGDTHLDVVTVHDATAEAAVLLGDGTARFEEVWKRSPTEPLPVALAVAALDADGNDDVAALSSTPGALRVLLAVGDGTLRDGGSVTVPDGASSIAAARLDANASTDLAVAVPGSAGVHVVFGQGDGTFPTSATVPLTGTPTWLVAADLDATAGTDLAVLDPGAGTVQVLRNNGSGSFTAGAAVSTGAVAANGLAAGDLSGDTRTDIVVTHDGGEITVLLGDGAGGLSARPVVQATGRAISPRIGEFSGGGAADLLVLLPDTDVALILPWEAGAQNPVLALATSYGSGVSPVGAVTGSFDSAATTLETIVIADSSDAPDSWSTTVLSGRRYDRFPHADAGPDRAICTGAPPITIGTPGKSFLNYAWNPATGLSSATVAQPTVTGSSTTTYTLTVTSPSTGYSSTDTVTVSIASTPAPVIQPNPAAFCSGSGPLVLDAGAGYASYLWSTGESTRTIAVTPSAPTSYSVTVSNSAGCTGMASRNVTVGESPVPVVSVGPNPQCQGTPSTVFVADASATQPPPSSTLAFAWAFSGPTSGWTISAPTAAITNVTATSPFSPNPVSLELTITVNPGGCAVTQVFMLEVLPGGSPASAGNSLLAGKTANGADLEWSANGASSYGVYSVTTKTSIPTIVSAPNLLATVAVPMYSHTTTSTIRFYQVEGSCP